MDAKEKPVADWYANHPISAPHIQAKLEKERGSLENVRPEELFPYDQDHYGALEANAALADHVAMQPGDKILDVCAGLCGPARWYAVERRVDVTGLDLSPNRVSGAKELNALVGLQDRVKMVEGSAMALPFADESFDGAVSQESFLHIPDKLRAVREVFRVLRQGSRFSFTDWVMHSRLPAHEIETYWTGFAAQNIKSMAEYRTLLEQAGFQEISIEDVTESWAKILTKRLEMYQHLNEEAQRAGSPSKDEGFLRSYAKFVEDVQTQRLGGARMTAAKPS